MITTQNLTLIIPNEHEIEQISTGLFITVELY